jgi:hypothetical protein
MVSDKGFVMEKMVGKEWSREVIKIWCEVLDGKDKSKYRNGGVWEMINGGKGRLVGENRLE